MRHYASDLVKLKTFLRPEESGLKRVGVCSATVSGFDAFANHPVFHHLRGVGVVLIEQVPISSQLESLIRIVFQFMFDRTQESTVMEIGEYMCARL